MIHVILPAYNEAESLRELLPALIETLQNERIKHAVYIVDDGSSDNTKRVIVAFAKANRQIKYVSHLHNKGLAEAINTGFREALKFSRAGDILITMDADNTHLPGLIIRMVRLISEGHDIVISSRFVAGSRVLGVPLHRRFLSLASSWIFRILFPIPGVKDYTCGYRAYRMSVIQQAIDTYGKDFISEKGFSCMVDILLKLRRFRPLCVEVPMILRYDYKIGKSKMNVKKTVAQTLWLILRYLVKADKNF